MGRLQLLVAFALLVLSASNAFAADKSTPPQELNGLEKVPNAKVDIAYVRPGVDWSKFRTVYIQTLNIPPEARDGTPSGTTRVYRESYVLREKEVAKLQQAYMDVMKDEMAKGGYTSVAAPQADTLVIAGQVLAILLNAPLEDTRMNYAGRGRTFTQGGGAMTIAAAFADGATGQVIAEAADRKYSNDIWGANNSVSNLADARYAFRSWAREIRQRLGEKKVASVTPTN
jgi:hypothetical protein